MHAPAVIMCICGHHVCVPGTGRNLTLRARTTSHDVTWYTLQNLISGVKLTEADVTARVSEHASLPRHTSSHRTRSAQRTAPTGCKLGSADALRSQSRAFHGCSTLPTTPLFGEKGGHCQRYDRAHPYSAAVPCCTTHYHTGRAESTLG
jgi:hypothetical protein